MSKSVRKVLVKASYALMAVLLLGIAVACASAQPMATPAASATAVPPVAPTTTTQPTATPIQRQATPTVSSAAPTVALPTATPASSMAPKSGGTMNHGWGGSVLASLDPVRSSDPGDYRAMYQIYDQIVQIEGQGVITPALASSWGINPDGKEITFRLQRGVKFQDGTDFGAQAVKAHFDRMLDPKQGSPRRVAIQSITNVTVKDQYTLTLQLSAPFRPLLSLLADRAGFIPSPTAASKAGANFGANPVGAGPFVFSQWIPDMRVVMKKNNNYWQKGLPYLETVDMLIVNDNTVQLAMLRTGETDYIEPFYVEEEALPIIRANPQLKFSTFKGSSVNLIHFNVEKAHYNNVALRQGLAYALDMAKFVKVIGDGEPAFSLYTQGWAYHPKVKIQDYDSQLAKQKLAEAGYTKATALPFGCRTTPSWLNQCEALQALYQDEGVNLQIRLMDPSSYNVPDRGYSGQYGLGLFGFLHWVDPHTVTSNVFDGRTVIAGQRGRYNKPAIIKLLDEAATVYDIEKAKHLYDQIEMQTAKDAPPIFLQFT